MLPLHQLARSVQLGIVRLLVFECSKQPPCPAPTATGRDGTVHRRLDPIRLNWAVANTQARGQTAAPPVETSSQNDSQASGRSGSLLSMGRKSHEKARRREDPSYKAKLEAGQAQRRGRAVQPTPEAYERAALSLGPPGIIEALLARHNLRWTNVHRDAEILGIPIAETLHVAHPLDVFLWKFGVRFTEIPSGMEGDWTGSLRWGIDSACQVSRMVLCGNALGGAAVARTQLERWSSNRSSSNELVQVDGVATSDYYTQLWQDEGPTLPAGDVWVNLSEGLHGRGPLVEAIRWESISLAAPSTIANCRDSVNSLMAASRLSLRQVLYGVATLAEDAGAPLVPICAMRSLPLDLPVPATLLMSRSMPLLLWPLDLNMITKFGRRLIRGRDQYLRDVESTASGQQRERHEYWERAIEAFISRRLRSIDWANRAFDSERQQLGEKFSPETLARREFVYTIIGETAALLAGWLNGPRSDALATASCALRAAYWLWLEDDDRAMILVRTIVEQAARLRAWRNKPDKAEVLESRAPLTSTRDWLETAGWRRLSTLNRSLGEFSHISANSRWTGAREALSLMQNRDPESTSEPIRTARGSALDEVVFAFGSELYFLVREYHAPLASAFESVLPYGEDGQSSHHIERWLQRCWDQRNCSFGESDFTTNPSLLERSPEKA